MGEPSLIKILRTGSVARMEIDCWELLLQEAQHHMVSEYLAYLSRKSEAAVIPPEINRRLNKIYKQNIITNSLIKREIETILTAMHQSDTRCLVLKGVPFAEKYYGDLGVRKSGDIDLLVEEKALMKAVSVLKELGYVGHADEPEAVNLDSMYHLEFKKATPFGLYKVELHFRFSPLVKYGLNMEGVWSRAVYTTYGQAPAYELSILDLLVFMCLHASHHRYYALRYMLDIAVILQVIPPGFAWKDFLAIVKQSRLGSQVYASLTYASAMFGTTVPDEVLRELMPSKELTKRLLKECPADRLPRPISLITQLLLENDVRSLRDYLTIIFPPANKIKILYGLNRRSQVWLYYPIRLWQMLKNVLGKYSY